MANHLIVISEDALVYEDLETLKTMPEFGKIWNKAAFVHKVRSVYPTVTYPCHATMMTGLYPDKHGIVNNEQTIMCERASDWFHFRDALRGTTIFDVAKANGLSTAAVFWPVTGERPGKGGSLAAVVQSADTPAAGAQSADKPAAGAQAAGSQAAGSIDYLVDEYWPHSDGESSYDGFVNSGSSPEVMDKIVAPNLPYITRYPRSHPQIDHFVHACACAIIREFKPNLLMIHPANIDAYRHSSGIFSPLVTHGLHEIDTWFGTIVKACEDAGILDDTDFVITSDHGQLNISRIVAPNVIFAENGLIDVRADGGVADYKAFCKSSALSAQVYLKDPSDRAAYDKALSVLSGMRDDGAYGISEIFTADEIRDKERYAGGFSFVIESDGYTAYSNDWTRPYLRPFDNSDYRFGRATHGHLPDKGPQPTMFAFGPRVRPGAVLERGLLVDQAPTFMRLLGLPLPQMDGKPIDEILV